MMKNQEPGELIEKQYIHLNIQNTTLNENSRSADLGTREWYNRMVQEKSSWKEKHCNWNKKKKKLVNYSIRFGFGYLSKLFGL